MKSLLIVIFVIVSMFISAQNREDIITLKDGSEIQCQILAVSVPDSIMQFCVRENGELKTKIIHTSLVDFYTWPGKKEAGKYCKMLGVKSINDGETYTASNKISQKHIKNNYFLPDWQVQCGNQLMKATSHFYLGTGIMIIGGAAIVAGTTLDYDNNGNYSSKSVAWMTAGGIIMTGGMVLSIEAWTHFFKAGNIMKNAGNVSLNYNRDGIGLVYRF